MKYLFLDIDGVLNHEEWYDKIHKHPELNPGPFPLECFDPDCVRRANEILKETDSHLVISSSWRLDKVLSSTFTRVGLPSEFLITPYFKANMDLDEFCRGDEIESFLKTHPCDNYVILDDDRDMLESQLDHFVNTAGDYWNQQSLKEYGGTGLTEKAKEKAINILNGTN